MTEERDPLLMHHDADGITELDNQLPRWWVWLFVITCIYAVVYLVYYHVLKVGPLSAAEYEQEMAAAKKAVPSIAMPSGTGAVAVAAATYKPSKDAATIAHGHDLFLKNCVVCHGPAAGGLIGPNLTDEFWIHGGTFPEIIHTIQEGVPAKGMITWKAILKQEDIQAVASFVWSIYGSKPANPKPADGVKVERPADDQQAKI